jgi:hypothetical protein
MLRAITRTRACIITRFVLCSAENNQDKRNQVLTTPRIVPLQSQVSLEPYRRESQKMIKVFNEQCPDGDVGASPSGRLTVAWLN